MLGPCVPISEAGRVILQDSVSGAWPHKGLGRALHGFLGLRGPGATMGGSVDHVLVGVVVANIRFVT